MTAATPMTAGEKLPRAEIAITQEMIDRYAAISGDYNPIHVDAEAAAKSPFGGTIAHGCIPIEPVFKALLSQLGRPDLPFGTEFELRYRQPSKPGDTIHVEAEIVGQGDDGKWQIDIVCRNQSGEPVLDGKCRVPSDDRPGS
ncbi:MAG: MaoC family dehydratase [Rhizobiaceae bacterium]|nr:MaoC family dehydratase [Rhizobiaceae bacterium]